MTIVSFTTGKYKFNGTIDNQNLVELVDAWYPNPVYGDTDYEADLYWSPDPGRSRPP